MKKKNGFYRSICFNEAIDYIINIAILEDAILKEFLNINWF